MTCGLKYNKNSYFSKSVVYWHVIVDKRFQEEQNNSF